MEDGDRWQVAGAFLGQVYIERFIVFCLFFAQNLKKHS